MFTNYEKLAEKFVQGLAVFWSGKELIAGSNVQLQWAGVLIVSFIVGVSAYAFLLGKAQERRLKKRADQREQEKHEISILEMQSKLGIGIGQNTNQENEKNPAT